MSSVYKAIAGVRQQVAHVAKQGWNEHQQYAYATESDLSREIRPLLDQAGLLILPDCTEYKIDDQGVTHILMAYTVVDVETGETAGPFRVLGSGSDPQREGRHGDKGAYKANTGAYKYLLTRLFMIDTGDDPEGDGEEAPEERPAPTRRAAPRQRQNDEPPPPGDYGKPPARSQKAPTRSSQPGSQRSSAGGNFASEKQIKLLRARSIQRANDLMDEGKAGSWEEGWPLANEIREAAYQHLGIPSEAEVPRSRDGIDSLIAAIESAVVDQEDDSIAIPGDEVPF